MQAQQPCCSALMPAQSPSMRPLWPSAPSSACCRPCPPLLRGSAGQRQLWLLQRMLLLLQCLGEEEQGEEEEALRCALGQALPWPCCAAAALQWLQQCCPGNLC